MNTAEALDARIREAAKHLKRLHEENARLTQELEKAREEATNLRALTHRNVDALNDNEKLRMRHDQVARKLQKILHRISELSG